MPESKPILDFEKAKLATVLGLILEFIGAVAGEVIVSGVGFVVWLIGVYALYQHYGSREILVNAVYSVVAGFIAVAVAAGLGATSVISGALLKSPLTALVGAGAAIILLWLLSVVAAYYFKKHVEALSKASPSEALERAGRYIFLGAVLSIVLVGIVLYLIGFAFLIAGLFELKPPTSSEAPQESPQGVGS
ncbi:hypothetical protein JCM10135_00130 [Stetteria hydrogenophila]